MSGFSADWLALREPHDVRARNPKVLDAVVASFKGFPSLRIVDLACGTGSTMRTLGPRLAVLQNWRLADNDLGLLARATTMMRPAGITVEAVPLDLNRDLEAVLDGPVDLVATSALLDLVSGDWLERLAFNAHQRTNKGFGPALGPAAGPAAITQFEKLGYSVVHGASDWVIGEGDRDIQMEIFAGWASAAREIGELSLADTAAWLTRRRDLVSNGRSSVRVGHVDVFARPMGKR